MAWYKATYGLPLSSFSSLSISCSHLSSPAMRHLVFFLSMRHCFQLSWCFIPLRLCTFTVFTSKCLSFSQWSFKTISKCPVTPWLPNKSFSTNSVPHIVDFLDLLYCGVITYVFLYCGITTDVHVCYSMCTIIYADTFIHQLFTDTTVNRIGHIPELMRLVLKNVCWIEMKSQDNLNFRFKFYALTRHSPC